MDGPGLSSAAELEDHLLLRRLAEDRALVAERAEALLELVDRPEEVVARRLVDDLRRGALGRRSDRTLVGPGTGRGAAAAAAWIFRGDGSATRRLDSPRGRQARSRGEVNG